MPVALIIIGGSPDDWGFIPSFLDDDDPRSAIEQFDANYVAGWTPFKGFTFDLDKGTLHYPGDPPLRCISVMLWRDERILLFPSGWVLVLAPDDTWQVARMD
jgi:hypothetical protein